MELVLRGLECLIGWPRVEVKLDLRAHRAECVAVHEVLVVATGGVETIRTDGALGGVLGAARQDPAHEPRIRRSRCS